MAEFVHRGVIEGFYGPPYSHEERLRLLDELGGCGMNRYVYAPKHDPLHRRVALEGLHGDASQRKAWKDEGQHGQPRPEHLAADRLGIGLIHQGQDGVGVGVIHERVRQEGVQ